MAEEIKNENQVAEAVTEEVVKPVITVEQVKEVSERIEKLNERRQKLEDAKHRYDAHKNDLDNIKKVYGEDSKQFANEKELISVIDTELKSLEDAVDSLSFKRSELRPYLDAATEIFDKERMTQANREYHIEIGSEKVLKDILEFCYHNMTWTPKTAPALMTLVNNLEENKRFAHSKDFDGVIILRSGNVLALQDFMLNKMEGRGWNTAKEFLACWANCGKNIGETVRNIQKEYDTARTYATYLNNIDTEFGISENDLVEDEMTTKKEVATEID